METTGAAPAACATLQHEHGALLRYLGRLQRGLGAELVRLETENMRLRAALLQARTAALWGLAPGPVPHAARPRKGVTEAATPRRGATHVGEVLCQVGCEGHAHPWLGEDGQCRRSGEACERLGAKKGARQR